MTATSWLVGLLLGLLIAWAALVIALLLARPKDGTLREAARLLPDLIRLLSRLASDPDLPWAVRVRLGLLLTYLAMPFDLIPDFLPVIGYADDAILTAWVLRGTVRRLGIEPLERLWPGTPDELAPLTLLARLAPQERL